MGFAATSRCTLRLLACAPLVCTLAALPTAALARSARSSSGGGGIGVTGGGGDTGISEKTSSSSAGTSLTATGAAVVKLGGVVNASGDGITLTVAASGTLGHPLTISGEAPTDEAGAVIEIEAARAGHANWTEAATATIAASGAFAAEWTPSTSAQVALRAVLTGDGSASSGASGLDGGSASTAAGSAVTSALTIPIFKNARATIYGPGFWGHHTACGQRLTKATLGVASRTLKCGTPVAVYFRGRELTVPVIDRGPFANHASWDLTLATARALGIRQTVTIGTLTPAPIFAVTDRL